MIQERNVRRTLKTAKKTLDELIITWLHKNILRDTWKNEILQQVTASNESPKPWESVIRNHIRQSWDKL
jgi:hypothetical protein